MAPRDVENTDTVGGPGPQVEEDLPNPIIPQDHRGPNLLPPILHEDPCPTAYTAYIGIINH